VSGSRLLLAGSETASMRQLQDILLHQGGYTLSSCTVSQVLERAREQQPDLVILMDRLEDEAPTMHQLKSDPLTRDLPLVVALSSFNESTAAQGLGLGADEFLVAPFQAQEVLARLAVLLKLRQDRRLLLAAQEEFRRLFVENAQPLFYCDRQGGRYTLNPTLVRLLGHPHQAGNIMSLPASDLFIDEAERQRFLRLLARPQAQGPVKVQLRSREGKPVTVLLDSLTPPERPADQEGAEFKVQLVGSPSSLKKAISGLLAYFLPAARDYLALMQMTPLLGGRYKKVKKLGQGSFGEVWLVEDTEALDGERHYVAKIPVSKAANPKFRKEAAICQKLAPHPGVVHLRETLEDDGKVILIQEYVEGETLDEKMGEDLSPSQMDNIILQLIEVVAYAHSHRIMHRDIKPNNIIIQPDGALKLLDYGAAKILHEKDISATIVGSRPFMAPEQIMGESERRSDIWAIGVIMYLLYTGDLPFYCEVEKVLIDLILEQEPVPPRQLNPEIAPALEAIILKCLKKKLEERYPQALALKADLLGHFPRYGAETDF